jgi:hypothetical protein
MPAWLCRFVPAGSALAVFLAMSWLYWRGHKEVYDAVLQSWGIEPFQFPFLDISGWLAAWECARQGIDVVSFDPCDMLFRGYGSSPLWLAAAGVPLGVANTTAVGFALDLVFIASLSLLPPPQRVVELLLVLAATLSTMVVFSLERANADVALFVLALAAGCLAQRGPAARIVGYGLALLSALLKYYPIMVLTVLFRERIAVFAVVALAMAGALAVFWTVYHAEIIRGSAEIATGSYNANLFASKNLPFLIGILVEKAAAPSPFAAAEAWLVTAGLYGGLVGAALAICRRLLRFAGLRAAIAELPSGERVLMVIGSAVIAGCFFAGQSVEYRGIFLLLVMPGLSGLSRSAGRELRALCLASAIVVVLLMWGECLRQALDGGFGFWLLRELGWWWSVSVMLALVADFLRESPVLCSISAWFRGSRCARGDRPEAAGQRRERGPRDGRGPRYC